MNLIQRAAIAFFVTLLFYPAVAAAELPGINVRVKNVSVSTGTIEVSLFNSAETFMREPFLQESGPVNENGAFETRFVAIPDGEYAVVVVHDANDNGRLDTGFLGFGSEDYGFSNNVRPWFGRPGFDQVKFTVDRPGITVEVDLD
ncbi:MAG: DUF2141 domain-containing protein [Xanthomonadales bacterium]|nr:DUF2141 domain-containing protein [Gammaproteobacteria bacterium]MBT8053960.1 DUF2141 domain-containing protein [Gammaproteobacteria bacterium]NND58301.1 DUF2141 domain-containing protein [Xanthomonadales bacterium]NNK51988.1 DUF2141 domain-containing protein [Xanthomonadales bacterium]